MYIPRRHRFSPWLIASGAVLVAVFLAAALRPILTPFVTAAVLAYILNPMTTRLARHIPRGPAAMTVMAAVCLILLILLLVIVPMLVGQVRNLSEKVPLLIHWLNGSALPRINSLLHTDYSLDSAFLLSLWEEHSAMLRSALKTSLTVVLRQGGGVITMFANFIVLPFLLYYFLLDWSRWTSDVRSFIPRRYIKSAERIMGELDQVLGEWLRGQLSVMLVMALIYGFGLSLTGLENGFAIGIVSGLLVFVPYLGAFTGMLLATLAALLQFSGWGGLIAVWSVFAVGQFLESFIITPKIVGDRIGLSPLAVIFALMAFGQLMGFVGMLLALPLAAVCVVLFREGAERYFKGNFYRET